MLLNRDRARATMERYGLDALVAVTPENVYYLSDYGTEHSFHFAPWGLSSAILPLSESTPPTLAVHEWSCPTSSGSRRGCPKFECRPGKVLADRLRRPGPPPVHARGAPRLAAAQPLPHQPCPKQRLGEVARDVYRDGRPVPTTAGAARCARSVPICICRAVSSSSN